MTTGPLFGVALLFCRRLIPDAPNVKAISCVGCDYWEYCGGEVGGVPKEIVAKAVERLDSALNGIVGGFYGKFWSDIVYR